MKKGQITIFLILSIIIVAILITGYYYRDQILKTIGRTGIIEEIVIPNEVKNIEEYVKECIRINGEEAIDLIGKRGGYINLADNYITLVNPLGNNLEFGGSIAYWFYQDNNGLLKENKPTIGSMEEEIRNYIIFNLDNCLDFRDFTYEIIKGEENIDVEIRDDEVNIGLEMPVRIYLEDRGYDLDDFNVVIEKPLGELFKLGEKIYDLEDKILFLEEKTLDMMAMYDEIPYSGIDFECTPRIWIREQVISDMKDILAVNIPGYNLGGGDKMLKVGSLNKGNVDVSFLYNADWPMLISTIPDDEILRGESYNEGLLGRLMTNFFCMNQYHIVYSLRYPILILLSKDDYVFQYGMQVVVDHNQARENKFIDVKEEFNSKICSNKVKDISVQVIGEGNFKDASVDLKCSRIRCSLGKIERREDGFYYEGKIPLCVNGKIFVEKEGYTSGEFSLSDLNIDNIVVFMDPVKEMNVEVRIERKLDSDEEAIVFFEGNGYSTNLLYPSQTKIKIAKGNYDISAYVIRKSDKIKIEGKDFETCFDIPKEGLFGLIGMKEKKCTTIKLESVELNNVMVGGGEFNQDISNEDLNKERMIIEVSLIGLPKDVDELADIYDKIKMQKGEIYFE